MLPTLSQRNKPLLDQALQHHKAGQLDKASMLYSMILKNDPKNARALFLMGALCFQKKSNEEALQYLQKTLDVEPLMPEALNSLGSVYAAMGQYDQAEVSFKKVVDLLPKESQVWLALGNVQKYQGKFEDAENNLRKAHELKPTDPVIINNLAILLKDLGRLEESLALYDQVLAQGSQSSDVFMNRGNTLQEMGRFEEALADYDRGLSLSPPHPRAHVNRARLLFKMGKYADAAKAFEWRLANLESAYLSACQQKRWDGSDLSGKSILIYGEQGIADEIFFASCIPDVLEQAAACYLECHPKLVGVFQKSFPKAIVTARSIDGSLSPVQQNTEIDYFIPMGSLPLILRQSTENYTNHLPHLKADPEQVLFWKKRIDALGAGLKIGISWKTQGADTSNALRAKSRTDIEVWESLLKTKNVHFVNLQYGETLKDRTFVQESLGVTIHDWDDLDLFNDLEGVLALVSTLDLIISIPTAVTSLAGGLGKPVWVSVPYNFTSIPGQEETYKPEPQLTYIPQNTPGDWRSAFDKVETRLKKLLVS